MNLDLYNIHLNKHEYFHFVAFDMPYIANIKEVSFKNTQSRFGDSTFNGVYEYIYVLRTRLGPTDKSFILHTVSRYVFIETGPLILFETYVSFM